MLVTSTGTEAAPGTYGLNPAPSRPGTTPQVCPQRHPRRLSSKSVFVSAETSGRRCMWDTRHGTWDTGHRTLLLPSEKTSAVSRWGTEPGALGPTDAQASRARGEPRPQGCTFGARLPPPTTPSPGLARSLIALPLRTGQCSPCARGASALTPRRSVGMSSSLRCPLKPVSARRQRVASPPDIGFARAPSSGRFLRAIGNAHPLPSAGTTGSWSRDRKCTKLGDFNVCIFYLY